MAGGGCIGEWAERCECEEEGRWGVHRWVSREMWVWGRRQRLTLQCIPLRQSVLTRVEHCLRPFLSPLCEKMWSELRHRRYYPDKPRRRSAPVLLPDRAELSHSCYPSSDTGLWSEWVSGWVSEWVSEWVSGWVGGWVSEWGRKGSRRGGGGGSLTSGVPRVDDCQYSGLAVGASFPHPPPHVLHIHSPVPLLIQVVFNLQYTHTHAYNQWSS